MKRFFLLATLLAAFYTGKGQQSIEFKLAGANERKWAGQHTYTDGMANNTAVLIFNHNHTFSKNSEPVKKGKKPLQWTITNGQYLTDDIIIKIDGKLYRAEFSQTTNGKDMLALSTIPANDHDEVVVKTYYADK